MSLTKKDKEEIRAIIKEECGLDFGEKLMESIRRSPLEQLGKNWEHNGTKSESTGLIISPEDIGGGYEDFSWDEAMGLVAPEGWRLPTRHEWAMIIEEFGQNPDGSLNAENFAEELRLEQEAFYWSNTEHNINRCAYGLLVGESNIRIGIEAESRRYNVRYVFDPEKEEK